MTLPAWFAVLVAIVAVGWIVAEVVGAGRRRRPVRVVRIAAAVTVAVFALAAAWMLGSAYGTLGMPRRYATYEPAPAVRPELLLLAGGAVAVVGGVLRADRSARSAERAGERVAQADRTTNLVLVLAGIGLALLGVLALLSRGPLEL